MCDPSVLIADSFYFGGDDDSHLTIRFAVKFPGKEVTEDDSMDAGGHGCSCFVGHTHRAIRHGERRELLALLVADVSSSAQVAHCLSTLVDPPTLYISLALTTHTSP